MDGNPNPYLRAYQEDFAARAQWCAHEPAACSHPAYVAEVTGDMSAAAGERVALAATIVDPDGRGFDAHWNVTMGPSRYAGAQDLSLWQECATDATFTVPADAQPVTASCLTLSCKPRRAPLHLLRPRSPSPSRSKRRHPHSARSVPNRYSFKYVPNEWPKTAPND